MIHVTMASLMCMSHGSEATEHSQSKLCGEELSKSYDGSSSYQSMEITGFPVIHYHRHNLKSRFELICTLGQGTYGKVKLAVESTGHKVAIKYIKKSKIHDKNDLRRIKREIKIMSCLHHPHIVNVSEVFENKQKIVMVMEYAGGGELYEYINSRKRLDEADARKIFRQILSAIYYCHRNGIVHRDLKLENIVLSDEGSVKLTDFGLSNFYSSDKLLSTYCGSPLYASPEIINGTPYIGPEVDCWSLGVVLYTLVYGAMPFDGSEFKVLRKQITSGSVYEPKSLSTAHSLIRALLEPNPMARASVHDAAGHWWVNVGYALTISGTPRNPVLRRFSQKSRDFTKRHSWSNSPYRVSLTQPKKWNVVNVPIQQNASDQSHDSLDIAVNHHRFPSDPSAKSSAKIFDTSPYYCDNITSLMFDQSRHDRNFKNFSSESQKFLPLEDRNKKVYDASRKPNRGILKNIKSTNDSDSGCVSEDRLSQSSSVPSPTSKVADSDDIYDLKDIENAMESNLTLSGIHPPCLTNLQISSPLDLDICVYSDSRNDTVPSICADSKTSGDNRHSNDAISTSSVDNHIYLNHSDLCRYDDNNYSFNNSSRNSNSLNQTSREGKSISPRKGILKPHRASNMDGGLGRRNSISCSSESSHETLDQSFELLNYADNLSDKNTSSFDQKERNVSIMQRDSKDIHDYSSPSQNINEVYSSTNKIQDYNEKSLLLQLCDEFLSNCNPTTRQFNDAY